VTCAADRPAISGNAARIADAIQRATRYVGSLTKLEALEKDEQAQDAIVRTIAVDC